MNELIHNDCLEQMKLMDDNSVDAVVTDPPYGLKFMGKSWDHGVPGEPFWREALRVAKPGAHLLAFGGGRTVHWLACAIEYPGWEIRDRIYWAYGSGFPKGCNISKDIDKIKGAEREVIGPDPYAKNHPNPRGAAVGQIYGTDNTPDRDVTAPSTLEAKEWDGWQTGLKPAVEPIIMARKPLEKGLTVAKNVLKWGVGGLNIDGCRIEGKKPSVPQPKTGTGKIYNFAYGRGRNGQMSDNSKGRWPANLVHDGSEEVLDLFPESGGDSGSAARFFYCAKASPLERGAANKHPTVKPLKLMHYLVRLITPPGGVVLDPFCGSGSTLIAAKQEGFNYIGIDSDEESIETANKRIDSVDYS